LAGAKNPTGQTVLLKKVYLHKLDFFYFFTLLAWCAGSYAVVVCRPLSSFPLVVRRPISSAGMVQANVGPKVMLITLSKGYFCTNFYIRWSPDVTSQSTTTQTTNKHHHHGDGAACPSSGMDSMIPRRPRGGQPCACSFRGRCRSILFDCLN
jgi:hypothetical protein